MATSKSLVESGPPKLTLASASPVRASLLRAAGVSFEVEVSSVDEAALKAAHFASGAGTTLGSGADGRVSALAEILACRKALDVAQKRRGLVIGADQTLEFEGLSYDKTEGLGATRARLLSFRGSRFQLHAAVAVAKGETTLWSMVETSHLKLRRFSEAWLDGYLDRNAAALAHSLAGFELEGEGVQLFDAVEGDYFAVLGLPLLPLLAFLREAGALDG